MNNEKIIEYIKGHISEKRILHILSVANEAEKMCNVLGLIGLKEKAVTAGLLHDITKEFSYDEHIALIKKYSISLTKEDTESLPVLHAFTGGAKAREVFGRETVDDEIYSAIFNHSTGAANMSDLDKIIFLSDYIEPTRDYPDCKSLREYFYSNAEKPDVLDMTVLRSLSQTISHIEKKGGKINSRTLKARDYLLKKE